MGKHTATFIGFIAVLFWSFLALLTDASGHIPPFQLSAMCFAIGGLVGSIRWVTTPARLAVLHQPLSVWFLGVGGLFGYHFFYFTALRNAPAVEASLIAYLWPLLIVFFSALLPGEKLKVHHVAGTILGLFGAVAIVTKGGSIDFQSQYAYGYMMAFVCALIWSGYSVVSRKFHYISTDVVAGFCIVTSILSIAAHLILEETVWPADLMEWVAIFCLGLGPVGLAFYVWDYGIKHGDIQVLGAASYMTPLLSTLLLVAFGFAEFTFITVFACLLITAGAVIAAKELLFKPNTVKPA